MLASSLWVNLQVADCGISLIIMEGNGLLFLLPRFSVEQSQQLRYFYSSLSQFLCDFVRCFFFVFRLACKCFQTKDTPIENSYLHSVYPTDYVAHVINWSSWIAPFRLRTWHPPLFSFRIKVAGNRGVCGEPITKSRRKSIPARLIRLSVQPNIAFLLGIFKVRRFLLLMVYSSNLFTLNNCLSLLYRPFDYFQGISIFSFSWL